MNLKKNILSAINWMLKFRSNCNPNTSLDSIKLSKSKIPQKYQNIMSADKNEAPNISLSPNSVTLNESNVNKRPHDREDEHDEDWVKRIQLDPEPVEDIAPRRKRRKFVLLLSYCGKGYLGMQRNPGFRTIEDDLLMAMLHGSLITEEGVTCPQIYRFQRAARTDKGVSAVRQIVSLKLPDDVDIPSVINKHLSEQIRVMKAVRVTQKFDSKSQCDCRSYSYLTPTVAFAPRDVTDEDYRITPEILEELRNILAKYRGVHNFHNFTARVKYNEHRAKRYIMDINCSDPFIRNGLEWTLIKVKGQSFMMHQIRKMVGLAISLRKGYISHDIFDRVWARERVDIPIAPGLGLALEQPHYNYYNRKYCSDGSHEPLLWDAEEEKIQAFREKYIDSVIVNTEKEEKSMLKWLETLEFHSFNQTASGQQPKPLIEEENEGKIEEDGVLDDDEDLAPENENETVVDDQANTNAEECHPSDQLTNKDT